LKRKSDTEYAEVLRGAFEFGEIANFIRGKYIEGRNLAYT
jgi:hypothetical protein